MASFTCPNPTCGAISHNPNDVAQEWCARCGMGRLERDNYRRLLPALNISADVDSLCQRSVAALLYLENQNYFGVRSIAGRWWVAVRMLALGEAEIIRGPLADVSDIADIWRYDTAEAAWRAADAWNGGGEPLDWVHHLPSHRRRSDGTAFADGGRQVPAGEIYVRPLEEKAMTDDKSLNHVSGQGRVGGATFASGVFPPQIWTAKPDLRWKNGTLQQLWDGTRDGLTWKDVPHVEADAPDAVTRRPARF